MTDQRGSQNAIPTSTAKMTTSFAYHPAPVMTSHFEAYSNDTYPDYLAATTNSYPVSSAFGDHLFNTPLTADALSVNPFAEVTTAAEQAFFAPATASDLAYSPARSHGENLVPPRLSASSESSSVNGTSSTTSALASPQLPPQYSMDSWTTAPILNTREVTHGELLFTTSVEAEINKISGFVDPTVLSPFTSPLYNTYPELTNIAVTPYNFDQPDSPAPSNPSIGGRIKSPPRSPFHAPISSYPGPSGRRQSTSSSFSHNSSHRSTSFDIDEIEKGEKGVCPIPDCGKSFKDLKTHMLTHQTERPEKCPIQSCEYHIKGFARKYDKNRHTLTHYKGTMVCGFCPGSGSSAEKSFNRADVFKRHLMSVHNVEQVPPNSRKKSPLTKKRLAVDASSETSGTCSTCSVRFANAQEFYEHLDDCVLRVVQQIEPSEDINQRHLGTINEDKEVKSTLEKHHLPTSVDYLSVPELEEDDDEDESGDNDDKEGSGDPRSGKGSIKIGAGKSNGSATLGNSRITKPGARVGPRPGLTYSKGGVRLSAPVPAQNGNTGNGRKKRKHYPNSWGSSSDNMNMKKRTLCVYDGQRRLVKDDMMLDRTFEVRVPLPDPDITMNLGEGGVPVPTTSGAPGNYITDLDYQTLKRADGIFSATSDEKGPWIPDNIYEAIDFKED